MRNAEAMNIFNTKPHRKSVSYLNARAGHLQGVNDIHDKDGCEDEDHNENDEDDENKDSDSDF